MTTATKPFQLDDRRSFRHPMAIVTRMRELGGPDAPVVLRDLSTVGFAGESHGMFEAPTLVAIQLPPVGEVRARIRRTADGIIGGEFLQRLDDATLERVLEHNPGSLIDVSREG